MANRDFWREVREAALNAGVATTHCQVFRSVLNLWENYFGDNTRSYGRSNKASSSINKKIAKLTFVIYKISLANWNSKCM